jgi:hypothetical protein
MHVQLSVERVLASKVPGDLIEAGVFRGGATIFMRAVLAAHDLAAASSRSSGSSGGFGGGAGGARRVFVADSFAGIPPSRRAVADGLQEECDAWEERYAVSEEEVRMMVMMMMMIMTTTTMMIFVVVVVVLRVTLSTWTEAGVALF